MFHSLVPAQERVSQFLVSESGPSQSFPLFLGAGRSQTRVRVRVAEPHVAEHMLQHDQKPHDPSIGTDKRKHCYEFIEYQTQNLG